MGLKGSLQPHQPHRLYQGHQFKKHICFGLLGENWFCALSLGFPSAVLLNLWNVTLLVVKCPFHRANLRALENTDIYIKIHNNSKITIMK